MKNMNKTTLFAGMALITSMLLFSCTPKGYIIKGDLSGQGCEGKTVFLYKGAEELIDSTTIHNGKFRFSGNLETPTLYTLKFFPDNSRARFINNSYAFRPVIPIFLENGTTTIQAKWEEIPLENFDQGYDYSSMKIKSTKLMDIYMKYAVNIKKYSDLKGNANKAYQLYLNSPEEKKVSIGIQAVNEIDKWTTQIRTFVKNFIKENCDNFVGLFALHNNIYSFTAQEIEEICAAFSPEMLASKYGQEVISLAEKVKQSAVGAKFIDHEFQTPQGEIVKFSDLLGKGKYTILEFWGAKCGPCRTDIPKLKEIYKLYQSDNLEIIGICTEQNKNMWTNAIKDWEIPWMQISDLQGHKSSLYEKYNFRSVPLCILISPDGTILNRTMRDARLNRQIIELFGNKFEDKY